MSRVIRLLILECSIGVVFLLGAGLSAASASSQATGLSGPVPASPGVEPSYVTPGTSTVPQGAAPDNTFSDCEVAGQYYFCLWENSGYDGTLWTYNTRDHGHNVWDFVGTPENDQASSGYNQRPEVTLIAKNYPPSDPDESCFNVGESIDNFVNFDWPDGSDLNDSISSYNLLEQTNCS